MASAVSTAVRVIQPQAHEAPVTTIQLTFQERERVIHITQALTGHLHDPGRLFWSDGVLWRGFLEDLEPAKLGWPVAAHCFTLP